MSEKAQTDVELLALAAKFERYSLVGCECVTAHECLLAGDAIRRLAAPAQDREALSLCEHAVVEGVRDLGLPSVAARFKIEFDKLRSALNVGGRAAKKPYGYLYAFDGCMEVSFSLERKSEYMRNEPWTETALYTAPLPQSGDVREALGPTQEYVLRAMAKNYADGNLWDRLDCETCIKAADEIHALRALSLPAQKEADGTFTTNDAWDNLINKDDRTSPEDYPEMALITQDELADYMRRATPDTAPDGVRDSLKLNPKNGDRK